MKGTVAVFLNELALYFSSPIGYILMAVFWGVSGYFFSFNVFFVNAAHMVTAFHNMSVLLLLLMPLATMRIFAEENKSGTMELLLTLPLGESAIVMGKFLAALFVLSAMLIGTAAAVIPLLLYSNPDLGPIIGGYAGVFLLGVTFLAIGMFISSLSSNQIVAAIVTWALLTLLWFADYGSMLFTDYSLVRIFRHVSFSVHYLDLIRGVITGDAIAYFLGLVALMLIGSCQSLRWRRVR